MWSKLSVAVVVLLSVASVLKADVAPDNDGQGDHHDGRGGHQDGRRPPCPKLRCGCNCNCKDLVFQYQGDRLPTIGPQGAFNYVTVENYTTNDGILSISNGTLIINSYPYTHTIFNTLDHYKFLAISNQNYPLPVHGELSYSAKMRTAILGVQNQPFNGQVLDPQSDFRLATTAMSAVDQNTGMIFHFFTTNTKIYAMYERLDFRRGSFGNYAGFAFAMPVGNTTPNQLHHYSINFNSDEKSVRWILDGEEVYKIYFTGTLLSRTLMVTDYGGLEEQTFPQQIQVAFGTFTYLDSYSPCNVLTPVPGPGFQCQYPAAESALVQLNPLGNQFNPRVGFPVPATYFEDGTNPAFRLFGQGAILAISELTVGYCKELRCCGRSMEDIPTPFTPPTVAPSSPLSK